MKFLIDECLSAKLAQNRGYGESSHVVWRKLQGTKDWKLMAPILDGGWTFVTTNSIDFRGPAKAPGSRGRYRGIGLHAGLVCLNGPPGMDLNLQLELFVIALDELACDGPAPRATP